MFKIFNLFVVCALFSIVSHASPGNYSVKFLFFHNLFKSHSRIKIKWKWNRPLVIENSVWVVSPNIKSSRSLRVIPVLFTCFNRKSGMTHMLRYCVRSGGKVTNSEIYTSQHSFSCFCHYGNSHAVGQCHDTAITLTTAHSTFVMWVEYFLRISVRLKLGEMRVRHSINVETKISYDFAKKCSLPRNIIHLNVNNTGFSEMLFILFSLSSIPSR